MQKCVETILDLRISFRRFYQYRDVNFNILYVQSNEVVGEKVEHVRLQIFESQINPETKLFLKRVFSQKKFHIVDEYWVVVVPP